MTDRLLRYEAGVYMEWFASPSGNIIGRLYPFDGGYRAMCCGWSFGSPSYHKARAALATELRRRRWTLPQ